MALTYTEIEQQKNAHIILFFIVVLVFYFVIALVLANAVKFFIVMQEKAPKYVPLFLTPEGHLYVLLAAFIAAVIHILYSVSNAMPLIERNLDVQKADPADTYHQRFNTIVEEVNVAAGSKYKITPVVIPTAAMNAFAISDPKRNAVLGVTEGLLARLNRQQLQAVVAHEVAHIASGDSLQTTVACSLFGIYAAMLTGIRKIFEGSRYSRGSGRGSGGLLLFLLFIYIILSVMQFFYTMIRFLLSRNRELRADAVAVRLTRDPLSLSEALYSISLGWRGFGEIDKSLEPLFIVNPVREAVDEKEGFFADLFSTHPPINKRIAILAQMAHDEVKNVEEKVMSQEKMREALREIETDKEKRRWLLRNDEGNWDGPFDIAQMMLLGWLKPDTWIKALGGDAVTQAKEEPLLVPIFDKSLEGLKPSDFGCPKCNKPLVEEVYEGTAVRHCVFCGGYLVDEGKMPRIIMRQEKGFGERVKKISELTQKDGLDKIHRSMKIKQTSLLECPKCGESMGRHFYTSAYFVEVDKCYLCDIIWFDKDELEMVQYLIEIKQNKTA